MYQCLQCGTTLGSNVSMCAPGFRVTGCADLASDNLTPLCGKCDIPDVYQDTDTSGIAWEWTSSVTGIECTYTCREGYFFDASGTCTQCPEGSVCLGGEQPPVSCESGEWTAGVAQKECIACPSNHYCAKSAAGLTLIACLAYESSPEGSGLPSDCSCANGFHVSIRASTLTCVPCNTGMFCIDRAYDCPYGTTSFLGTVNVSGCQLPDDQPGHQPNRQHFRPPVCIPTSYTNYNVERRAVTLPLPSHPLPSHPLHITAHVGAGHGVILVSEDGVRLVRFVRTHEGTYTRSVIAGKGIGSQEVLYDADLLNFNLFTSVTSLASSRDGFVLWVGDYTLGVTEVRLSHISVHAPIDVNNGLNTGLNAVGTCIRRLAISGVRYLLVNQLQSTIIFTLESMVIYSLDFQRQAAQRLFEGTGSRHITSFTLAYDETFYVVTSYDHNGHYLTYIDTGTFEYWEDVIEEGIHIPVLTDFTTVSPKVNLLPLYGKSFMLVRGGIAYNATLQYVRTAWTIRYTEMFTFPLDHLLSDRFQLLVTNNDTSVFMLSGHTDENALVIHPSVHEIRAECVQCPANYMSTVNGIGASSCTPSTCPSNHWCSDGLSFACPSGTVSPIGSEPQSSCRCADGSSIGCDHNCTRFTLSNFTSLPVTPVLVKTWDYYAVSPQIAIAKPGVQRCTDAGVQGGCVRRTVSGVMLDSANVIMAAAGRIWKLDLGTAALSPLVGANARLCVQETFKADVLLRPYCIGLHVHSLALHRHTVSMPVLFGIVLPFSSTSPRFVIAYDIKSDVLRRYVVPVHLGSVVDLSIPVSGSGTVYMLSSTGHLLCFDAVTRTWGNSVTRLHSDAHRAFYVGDTRLIAMIASYDSGLTHTIMTYSWNSPHITVALEWVDRSVAVAYNFSLPYTEKGVSSMQPIYETDNGPPMFLAVASHSNSLFLYGINYPLDCPVSFSLEQTIRFVLTSPHAKTTLGSRR
eukprot:2804321-Rhodomonas_salina.1